MSPESRHTHPADLLDLTDALRTALDAEPSTIDRLTEALSRSAAAEDLLDVAVRRVDSPFGSLLIAVTPVGVLRVAFDLEGHDAVLADLAQRVSPRIIETSIRTDGVARQLDEYFAGSRRRFDVPVDLRLIRGFRRQVVEELGRIPYGTTATYAGLAANVGNPTAVRAVGSACANNPLPVIVPCHRVVRSDGKIGNYLGGTEVKKALLAMEAA